MTINDFLQSYRTGRTTPRALLADLLQRLRTDADQAIFIHLLTDSGIEPYLAALDGRDPSSLPLFGVPFAIKDNIDLARIPTTAACARAASAGVATRTAAAKPLILDLGQGLAYHRAQTLPADLPAASPARPQPLVLDLRYTTGGPDAAITLAAWLKFRAVPRTPVFILANAETSPALRAAFAEREDTPGLIVLGLNGPDFTPDLALTADPATARRAYDALTQPEALTTLITPTLTKARNDEAALAAEWHPDRSGANP